MSMKQLCKILATKGPSVPPSAPFDTPYLYTDEVEAIMDLILESRNSDMDTLIADSCEDMMEKNLDHFWASMTIYATVYSFFLYKGDSNHAFSNHERYIKLIHSVGVSLIHEMSVDGLRIRSMKYIHERDQRLSLPSSSGRDSSFLFHPFSVAREYRLVGDEEESITNDELRSMFAATMDALMETNGSLEKLSAVLYSSMPHVYKQSRRESRKQAPTIEEVVDVKEEVDSLKPVRDLIDIATKHHPTYGPSFSTYWMAPPPIGPMDVHNMNTLSPIEAALVLDSFLDLYHAQMMLMGMYFLVHRNLELWERGDSGIEGVLFQTDEMRAIQRTLEGLSQQLPNSFSIKFLALEGIALGGRRLLDTLDNTRSKATEDSDPVIDVRFVIEQQLRLITNGIVALERLRVSILYGREHRSYVGDDFLSSYISLFYKIQHAEVSFDNILALVSPIASMSLPKDEEKVEEFLDELCKRIPSESKRHGLREPELRSGYEDNSPVGAKIKERFSTVEDRLDLPTEGQLSSEYRSGGPKSKLFGILERMWEDDGV